MKKNSSEKCQQSKIANYDANHAVKFGKKESAAPPAVIRAHILIHDAVPVFARDDDVHAHVRLKDVVEVRARVVV